MVCVCVGGGHGFRSQFGFDFMVPESLKEVREVLVRVANRSLLLALKLTQYLLLP